MPQIVVLAFQPGGQALPIGTMSPAAGDAQRVHKVIEARAMRASIAGQLVQGSCDLGLLTQYRDWLTISRLLGDIEEEEAKASYDRACQVYSANCKETVSGIPAYPQRPPEPNRC